MNSVLRRFVRIRCGDTTVSADGSSWRGSSNIATEPDVLTDTDRRTNLEADPLGGYLVRDSLGE